MVNQLQLPSDVLYLRQQEVSIHGTPNLGWVVCCAIPLPQGSSLGPFQGQLVVPEDVKVGDLIVQFHNKKGQQALMNVAEQSGGWLALLRTPHTPAQRNTHVYWEGGRIWCEIVSDIDMGTELRASFSFQHDDDDDEEEENGEGELQASEIKHRRTCSSSSPSREDELHPRLERVKVEPTTTSNSNSSSNNSINTDTALIYGCPFCGVRFSSPRTLQGHLSFYCSKKTADTNPLVSPTPASAASADKHRGSNQVISEDIDTSNHPLGGTPDRYLDSDESYHTEKHSSVDKRMHTSEHATNSLARIQDGRDKTKTAFNVQGLGVERHPATILKTPSSETFCKECKIQFSSMRTYKCHKEHYCAQRRKKALGDPSPFAAMFNSPFPFPPDAGVPTTLSKAMPNSEAVQQPHTSAAIPITDHLSRTISLRKDIATESQIMKEKPISQIIERDPHRDNLSMETPQSHSRERRESRDEDHPLDLSVTKTESNKTEENRSLSSDSLGSPRTELAIHPNRSPSPINPSLLLPPPDFLSATSPSAPSYPAPSMSPLGKRRRPASPSVLAKSISKCLDCNIVFYKHDNYLIHKKHYCSGKRRPAQSSSSSMSPSSPNGFQAQNATFSPRRVGVASLSPRNQPEDSPTHSGIVKVSSPQAPQNSQSPPTQQAGTVKYKFYCVPCRIKFSNASILEAHKEFYCPAGKDSEHSVILQSNSALSEAPGSQEHTVLSSHEDEESHQRRSSSSPEPQHEEVTCTRCNSLFTSARLLRLHVCDGGFPCPHCDHVAITENRLAEHLKVHAPTRAYRCTICGYRGNTARGMRMHGKTHIDEGLDFTDENMLEYEEPAVMPILSQVPSSSLSGGAATDSELLRLKNEPYKRRRSRKAYEKFDYPLPKVDIPQTCPLCGQNFANAEFLASHFKVHQIAASQYLAGLMKCIHCSYVGNSPEDLRAHFEANHASNHRIHLPQRVSPAETTRSRQGDIDTEYPENDQRHSRELTSPREIQTHMVITDPNSPLNERNLMKVEPDSLFPHHSLPFPYRNHPALPIFFLPGQAPLSGPRHPFPLAAREDQGSRYCHNCDISFSKQATFLAHKKYYCTARPKGEPQPSATA
ncbi:hypothetical protein EGW08_009593 [Elysia chlorotica]|uniref:C2H2-type domain-containing protein n=1 Tax=Elysia chlorotica TaxID=188477 RepID=A0A3S1BK25_ELYCH|nr:hypothetical protein EGW08_009593 [Elysia chlorotica]